jgi:hypothetical protein
VILDCFKIDPGEGDIILYSESKITVTYDSSKFLEDIFIKL